MYEIILHMKGEKGKEKLLKYTTKMFCIYFL